ncbi:MAG: hypothetical protein AABZ18_05115, partial [Pseudomonadota bacterium]
MLNISIAPQIKSSTDNPAAMASSGSVSTKEPVTEEFGKILEREVSEAPDKHETNNASSKPEPSESALTPEDTGHIAMTADTTTTATTAITAITAITDISGASGMVASLLLETAASPYKPDQSLLALDPASNPDTVVAAPILPVISPILFQNPVIPQDNEQVAGAMPLPVNLLLQQRPAPLTAVASNLTYSPANLWQSLDMADSAVYGKILPFSSEMSEAIQINTGESIFPAPEESVSAQPFSLNSATSTASLNTAPQDISVDLPVGQPKWGGEFAQKVIWMTTQQHQVA